MPSAPNIFNHVTMIFILVVNYIYFTFLALLFFYSGNLQSAVHPIAKMTLDDFCRHYRLSSFFMEACLVPLFSAVCTAPQTIVRDYPAAELLEYKARTFLKDHYILTGSVSDVVQRLSKSADQVHLSTSIQGIKREENKYILLDNSTEYPDFDHLVLATPTAVSAKLTQSLSPKVSYIVSQIPYNEARITCHSDISILPRQSKHWRDINLYSCSTDPNNQNATEATHIIDISSSSPILQTTNSLRSISPKYLISSALMKRAYVTLTSKALLKNLIDYDGKHPGGMPGCLQGLDNLWICGSWTWRGIPLLEGCVASASVIANGIIQG